MDRQNIIKMALLALSVVALVYLISTYSKSQKLILLKTLMSSGENFEQGGDHPEDQEAQSGGADEHAGHSSDMGENFGTEYEEFTGHAEVQASEALGSNEVYQSLGESSDGNQHPKDCFQRSTYPW